MIEIKHVLCAVDFSDASRHALKLAAAVARWYGSELTALHVFHSVPWYGVPAPRNLAHGQAVPVIPTEFAQTALVDPPVRQAAQDELRRLVEETCDSAVPTHVVVSEGDVVDEILQQADERVADLVVMGSHGRRGFERWVLGSVAEQVLRKTNSPVLTVSYRPDEAREDVGPEFKRIVCPVDFSAASMRALRYALSLAQEADARLTVMHVLDELAMTGRAEEGTYKVPEYREHLARDAREQLAAAVPPEASAWCDPNEILVTGKPYQEILKTARDRQADLIVMGTHGGGIIDRMFVGSTANHVVRDAPCPVLTIRGERGEVQR